MSTMREIERMQAEADLARRAADDLAETAARAKTGDLEPDGSWSLSPLDGNEPPPSVPRPPSHVAAHMAGGMAGALVVGLLWKAIFD